jgi:prevent-host-death family protein
LQGPITITQRGKPRLILMSVEEYNRLRGKLLKVADDANQL